jgi:hypothetical protein
VLREKRSELCYKEAMATASTASPATQSGSPASPPQHRLPGQNKATARIAEAGTGTERRYSFSDLLALRVAGPREAGISTQSPGRVVAFLRTRKGLTSPLAECHLIVTGSDVQVATRREKILSALLRPGQTSFAFVFDLARTVDEMRQETSERKPPARAPAPQPARRRAT